MFANFYLVVKDAEQAERIKNGASIASSLRVCNTYNEARQVAVEYVEENPEIDVIAVMTDPAQPDLEIFRRVGWYTAEQIEDASMFAGLGVF